MYENEDLITEIGNKVTVAIKIVKSINYNMEEDMLLLHPDIMNSVFFNILQFCLDRKRKFKYKTVENMYTYRIEKLKKYLKIYEILEEIIPLLEKVNCPKDLIDNATKLLFEMNYTQLKSLYFRYNDLL